MDKRALQLYAVWAKNNLESQIEVSLKTLGINSEKDIKAARKVGDYTIIDGDSNSYPGDLKDKRDSIVKLVKTDGYKQVIEEFAYTWFNRIVALRFMEVHDFLPHGFRVLSSRDGGVEPEIMKHLDLVKDELKLDLSVVQPLYAQGKLDEAYSYVLFRQCYALSGILPMLFDRDQDYLELLLPKALLKGETFITKLMEIGEDDFLNDVEVIGWLYQFYISQKKDAVFAAKKTITKDNLAAVTQLFTPDWIVRYMAENSIGRIWLESYPNSSLKSEMKYYVEDAKQEADVQAKLDSIRYKNVNPEEIRIIEPCCGSGHILVYVFDLLYKMYEERGYQIREIPTLILKNNLVGLDVDKRAAQLASFALVMKARSKNSRFFNSNYFVKPEVYEIWDARDLIKNDYERQMQDLKILSNEEVKSIKWLVEKFIDAKTIGSLQKFEINNFEIIEKAVAKIKNNAVINIFNTAFLNDGIKCLERLIKQAKILSSKYDVMITNPPYVNINNLDSQMKEYANLNYGRSKADMFSMFIDHSFDFVVKNGFSAFMTPYVWMFIKSYEELRKMIFDSKHVETLIQLEYSALEEAIVPLCTFVLRNTKSFKNSSYFRLSDFRGGMAVQNTKFLEANSNKDCGYYYSSDSSEFKYIPGMPFAYWITPQVKDIFKNCKSVSHFGTPKQGMSTCDVNRFVKLWFEVDLNRTNIIDRKNHDNWVIYNKGGEYRKWYGNQENIVYWGKNGSELKKNKAALRNQDSYFDDFIAWTKLSSGSTAFRNFESDFLFDGAGGSLFLFDKHFKAYLLGWLNTKIVEHLLKVISPTLNYNESHIGELPVCYNEEIFDYVSEISSRCIKLAKEDWDEYETSWDFKKMPLIKEGLLKEIYENYCAKKMQIITDMKKYEENISDSFSKVLNLNGAITTSVDDSEITLHRPSESEDIRHLISYLVGIEMGRYSLDVDGLAYAGGEWNPMNYVTYQPDDDGIIPIYTQLGMADGLTARIIKLIKHIYGEDTYRENIEFIAEALGKNQNESAEETLNRYLNYGFYADHLKTYQKRPIYWMFSSGKNDAFKCLVYLHRYNEDTLAKINSKYFLNESARLNVEVNETRTLLEAADGREKLRLDKQMKLLNARQKEMIEYGQVLDHMANQYINLDLDDGVKVNYAKFQGIEIVNDSGAKVKKDLLVPIK